MNIQRFNRAKIPGNLRGIGACGCASGMGDVITYGQNFANGGAQSGTPVPYATQAWYPPSAPFNTNPSAVNTPGSAANALSQATSDGITPTALIVADSFSSENEGGGNSAQPGVLRLTPNVVADTLSFVRSEAPTVACEANTFAAQHPIALCAVAFGIVYLLNSKKKGAK